MRARRRCASRDERMWYRRACRCRCLCLRRSWDARRLCGCATLCRNEWRWRRSRPRQRFSRQNCRCCLVMGVFRMTMWMQRLRRARVSVWSRLCVVVWDRTFWAARRRSERRATRTLPGMTLRRMRWRGTMMRHRRRCVMILGAPWWVVGVKIR